MADKKFNVMLAQTYKPDKIEDWTNIRVETKLDGIRVIVLITPQGRVSYHSRNGRKLRMFSHLDDEIKAFKQGLRPLDDDFDTGCMLDGEMTCEDAKFGSISGAIHRKDYTATDARYYIFHAMPLIRFKEGEDDTTQGSRRHMVDYVFSMDRFKYLSTHEPRRVHNDEGVKREYRLALRYDHEGLMVKDMSSGWVGKRSTAWLKLKEEKSIDIVVKSLKKGSGKYAGTLGALICEYKGKPIPVSGMTDDQRDKFWRKPKSIIGKMVEVVYQKVTVHGKFRHARFKRLRTDKQ